MLQKKMHSQNSIGTTDGWMYLSHSLADVFYVGVFMDLYLGFKPSWNNYFLVVTLG
jgi:hypothetical protein